MGLRADTGIIPPSSIIYIALYDLTLLVRFDSGGYWWRSEANERRRGLEATYGLPAFAGAGSAAYAEQAEGGRSVCLVLMPALRGDKEESVLFIVGVVAIRVRLRDAVGIVVGAVGAPVANRIIN